MPLACSRRDQSAIAARSSAALVLRCSLTYARVNRSQTPSGLLAHCYDISTPAAFAGSCNCSKGLCIQSVSLYLRQALAGAIQDAAVVSADAVPDGADELLQRRSNWREQLCERPRVLCRLTKPCSCLQRKHAKLLAVQLSC